MLTINDLIKDVYFPPEQNPSRICKCVEKNLEDFLILYTSLSNTTKPKESYLTEFNKILDALQDVNALSLGDVLSNGVRKIVSLDEDVWKDVNPKYLRVTKRQKAETNIDLTVPMVEQEVIKSSPQPFESLVALKYLQKQINAQERGLEFTLTLQDMRALLKKKTCYYSGVTLTLTGETALSLDRIDDSVGYTKLNTVACASVVNKVKNELLEKNLCKGLTNTQIKRMLSAFVNII